MEVDGVMSELVEKLAAATDRVHLYEAFACAVEMYLFGDVRLRDRDVILVRLEDVTRGAAVAL